MAVAGSTEADPPLSAQNNQRNRRDRLANRGDAEDRVLTHRLAALDIHWATYAGMDEVTLAPDVGQHARQIAAIDIAPLHHFVEPRQPHRRHAYRFGFHQVPPPRASRLSRSYGPTIQSESRGELPLFVFAKPRYK